MRKLRVKIKGTRTRPRLSVFRSNKFIYAQIIDDEDGKTLVAADERAINRKTKKMKDRKTKAQKAKLVGKLLAEKALKVKIKAVVFDRRVFRYHGRVKALAEGAREGGLVF